MHCALLILFWSEQQLVNLRKSNGPLKPQQCRPLEHAWHQAAKDGYPLDTLISVRCEKLTLPQCDQEYAELVNKTWNYLGVWSRRNTKQFYCVLVCETLDKFGRPHTNFHALIHVGSGANRSLLRYALTKRFPEPGEVEVGPANQNVRLNHNGKIESAIGYISKERTGQAAWPHWQYRRGGLEVLGKRYRITANLRARPVDVSVAPQNRAITGRQVTKVVAK